MNDTRAMAHRKQLAALNDAVQELQGQLAEHKDILTDLKAALDKRPGSAWEKRIVARAIDSLRYDGELPPAPQALDWKPMTELPKENCGWYAAAVLPVNHEETSVELINEWRSQFGFTKVWYNHSGANGRWWEPDPHGHRSKLIGDRMTHWAELPRVPRIEKPTQQH